MLEVTVLRDVDSQGIEQQPRVDFLSGARCRSEAHPCGYEEGS
jgi:hypothetical protein